MKWVLSGGALVLAGSYPTFIERTTVLVNHYKIPLPRLPAAFHGFRLAQLTDIHLGQLVSAAFVEGLVQRTNRLGADAILCTGDFVHARNTIEEIDQIWPLLAKLHANYGVYSVLGNHDHWADTDRSLYWLERTGQDLRHQSKVIYKGKNRIILGGAGDFLEDQLKIDEVFARSDERDCRILLSHNPDSVDSDFDTPLDLVISGHTHGGQVVVPLFGPVTVPVDNKNYTSGLIATPKTQLFISRGIGWSILPVRFNCYPEIAVLELLNPKLLA
ncbi:metallophosphoesterase [Crenothrix polyspora]|uniref:Metallophosphoesterase n=1 Tax=Crenothrix polyspora TaxID=360316 RepID=A0A1R4H1K7_9GAMM|nr:metallophosphoesterase [Crenothrix polyspora]SJM90124.1 Metallophosphoesterase [Crenothrix polyspora]